LTISLARAASPGSLRTHRRHVHVQIVRVHVPGRHIVNCVSFVGLGIVHVQCRTYCCGPSAAIPETASWTIAGILRRHGGRAMAGNGGEKDAYEKECAEQDAALAAR